MQKLFYEAPRIDLLSIIVERGFLGSDYNTPAPDYNDNPNPEDEDA